eukprot:5951733-Ditylum_brightwellii.AAC.1
MDNTIKDFDKISQSLHDPDPVFQSKTSMQLGTSTDEEYDSQYYQEKQSKMNKAATIIKKSISLLPTRLLQASRSLPNKKAPTRFFPISMGAQNLFDLGGSTITTTT